MTPQKSIWEKLQEIDRRILYLILAIAVTVPLWIPAKLPVIPDSTSMDLYGQLMSVPEDKTVFVQSDWTVSTRGESQGHLEALLRILMARRIKFVIYAAADPQAPQVFRNVILGLNQEREARGLPPYRQWEDYIDLGAFLNAEGTLNSIGQDVRKLFGPRRSADTEGRERPVLESPVLSRVQKIGDAGLYVVVTASATIDVAVQRISGKTKLAAMTTGVVFPSVLPFYQSGQVVGAAGGLKGVYDMEFLMANGVNVVSPTGKVEAQFPAKAELTAPPLTEIEPKTVTFARGQRYFLSFHAAIVLLIIAVVVGNIGMYKMRKNRRGA